MITAKMVKELRELTGAGMMNCKKALSEVDGDMDKAVEILREKGLSAAAKKSGRIAAEGLVITSISEDKRSGAIVEVNCETDFVAANDDFKKLASNISKQAITTEATTVEEFTSEKYIEDNSKTIKEAVIDLIAKLGENMSVRRFNKFSIPSGVVESYIHAGGRIGVLLKLECEKESEILSKVAKDLAMQVAAVNPLFLNEDMVDTDTLEKEKEIYRVQALNEGKPEKIVERMVDGRIKKYFKENCLIDQIWVKNGDYTIKKYLKEKSKEIGSEIKVTGFVRYERGEGIEKKEEDFAEEVKRQMQQGK